MGEQDRVEGAGAGHAPGLAGRGCLLGVLHLALNTFDPLSGGEWRWRVLFSHNSRNERAVMVAAADHCCVCRPGEEEDEPGWEGVGRGSNERDAWSSFKIVSDEST